MAHSGMSDYMAHGFCFLWDPRLVWLHVISDILTGLAYYSIPIALFYFIYKRRDLPFLNIFILFGIFIFSCGTSHLLAAYTVYVPAYWYEGIVKAITAFASVISAFLFIPLLPKAVALPSLTKALEQIKRLNKTLEKELEERRRQGKELQDKNAELERFIYTVSHDLKSPLVTVKTFLGYLEQDMLLQNKDRIAQDMGYMHTASEKMERLLNELLELSRIGRAVNPPVRVLLGELAEEVLNTVAGGITERGVKVQVYNKTIPLNGDRARLAEIWQNLVENAVKYMGDQSAPCIKIGAETKGKDTVFFVSDNGIGIDPAFKDKVFGLFEKLDPKSEGTGIGLALVKRIVALYKGEIWFESEGVGRGTCFRFTLPEAANKYEEV